MIKRALVDSIMSSLQNEKKIVIIYGGRQTGKTTLSKEIIERCGLSACVINGDEKLHHDSFSSRNYRKMMEVVGNNNLLFIDEAQQIHDIGMNLKIVYDRNPDLKILVTGSSAFDLSNRMQESLTGRTRTFQLFPVSIEELAEDLTIFELKQSIEQYLLFGMYPEVLTISDLNKKRDHLIELSSSYLYKDILQLANIRNSNKIRKLLQLVALQIGSLVSINKLSNALDMSHETVNHYLDLLEKSFVIFRRSGYSKNLSKEISKMDKIYFYDVGIRNAILENFNRLELRQDKGALWENFIVAERTKKNKYQNKLVRSYYWRVYTGAEIDLIEDIGGQLSAFEIKSNYKIYKAPKTWSEYYPHSSFDTINMNNWVGYVA